MTRGCGILPGLRRGRPEFSVSRSSAAASRAALVNASSPVHSESHGTRRPRRAMQPRGDAFGKRFVPTRPTGDGHLRPPFARPSRWLDLSIPTPYHSRGGALFAARRDRPEGRFPLLRVFFGSSRVREDFPHCDPPRRFTRFEPSRRARIRPLLSALDIAPQLRDATSGRQSETSPSLRHASGYIFNLRSLPSRINPFRSFAVVSRLPNGGWTLPSGWLSEVRPVRAYLPEIPVGKRKGIFPRHPRKPGRQKPLVPPPSVVNASRVEAAQSRRQVQPLKCPMSVDDAV